MPVGFFAMSKTYVAAALRRLVANRSEGLREYCLIHGDDTFFGCEVDHIISEKHGGLTIESNLAAACLDCNRNRVAISGQFPVLPTNLFASLIRGLIAGLTISNSKTPQSLQPRKSEKSQPKYSPSMRSIEFMSAQSCLKSAISRATPHCVESVPPSTERIAFFHIALDLSS